MYSFVLRLQLSPTQIKCTCNAIYSTYILYGFFFKSELVIYDRKHRWTVLTKNRDERMQGNKNNDQGSFRKIEISASRKVYIVM